jgi:hypothetical protein
MSEMECGLNGNLLLQENIWFQDCKVNNDVKLSLINETV